MFTDGDLNDGERFWMKEDDCFVAFYAVAVECDASRVARAGLELDGFHFISTGGSNATRRERRRRRR